MHLPSQMGDSISDGLLHASAETAAQAVLMTQLTALDEEHEDMRLASKVMTGGEYQFAEQALPSEPSRRNSHGLHLW